MCYSAAYHNLNVWTAYCCSLNKNALCGVWWDNRYGLKGTYTTEGITALCEGLKESKITSLK